MDETQQQLVVLKAEIYDANHRTTQLNAVLNNIATKLGLGEELTIDTLMGRIDELLKHEKTATEARPYMAE